VARSAAQRAALAGDAAPLLSKAAALDRVVQRVRDYPILTGAVAAGIVLLGSRRIFDAAARVLTLYALLKR
jgi:small ligand-binding sensory domain FIST